MPTARKTAAEKAAETEPEEEEVPEDPRAAYVLFGFNETFIDRLIEKGVTPEDVDANFQAGNPPDFKEWQDPEAEAAAEARAELAEVLRSHLAKVEAPVLGILLNRETFTGIFGPFALRDDGTPRGGFAFDGHNVGVDLEEDAVEVRIVTAKQLAAEATPEESSGVQSSDEIVQLDDDTETPAEPPDNADNGGE